MKSSILAAAAVLLIGAASAASPASPACALLTDEETARFLGGKPTLMDGGPETAGTSSCSWLVQASGGMIGVQMMTPAAFGGAPGSYYDMMVSGVTNAGQKVETLQGIGTKAVLIADPTGMNMVIMAQVGEKLLNLTTMNLQREAMIEAAILMAGRM